MIGERNYARRANHVHQIVATAISVLLAAVLIVSPVRFVLAQGRNLQPQLHLPDHTGLGVVASSAGSAHNVVTLQPIDGPRDRRKGALYGLAIGALVGGIGLAAAAEILDDYNTINGEYRAIYLTLGAAAGGATGAVIGAIIRAPKQSEPQPARLRMLLIPELSGGGGSVLVSMPFQSP